MPALAAAAIVAVVVIVNVHGSSTRPTKPAAHPAAGKPWHWLRRGQYLYVESRALNGSDTMAAGRECVIDAIQQRQVWIGADGTGLIRERVGRGWYTSAADPSLCRTLKVAGSQLAPARNDDWFARGCLSIGPTTKMGSLSSDPRRLLAQMSHYDGGPPGPGEDFVHVGDFLRETYTPLRLREALYRTALTITGVRSLGMVHDHNGRIGLGVELVGGGARSELIFAPRTYMLLAEQTLSRTGRVLSWTVYLRSEIVDRLPGKVPAKLGKQCAVHAILTAAG